MFFFFSSRRRHTRLQGDWSSDVCSSDLMRALPTARRQTLLFAATLPPAITALARELLRDPVMINVERPAAPAVGDRKSTRLNSSHLVISYAVFCLKKKKKNITTLHKP